MKWEYKRITFEFGIPEKELVKLGNKGWEMCGLNRASFYVEYYFKRPKPEEPCST